MLTDALHALNDEGASNQPAFPDGNWVFLLPTFALRRVLIVGRPSQSTAYSLAALADHVDQGSAAAELEPEYDLIYFTRPPTSRDWETARRLLGPLGLVFFESLAASQSSIPEYMVPVQEVHLFPLFGRVRAAIPQAHYRAVDRRFIERMLYSASLDRQTLEQMRLLMRQRKTGSNHAGSPAVRQAQGNARHKYRVQLARKALNAVIGVSGWFERNLLLQAAGSARVHRRGYVVQRAAAAPAQPRDALPEYIQSIARDHGLDFGGCGWAYSAKGRYNSQKLLFYLFEPDGQVPSVLVKLVRSRVFNARLEREYHGLKWLEDNANMPAGTFPRALFLGYHRGQAVVGERVIAGSPFETLSSLRSDCPHARKAAQWLIDLSVRTAAYDHGVQLARQLQDLVAQFSELYQPTPEQRLFLAAQASALDGHPLPAVFQHGDPGSWNLLVTPDQDIAFLDWENASLHGPPLWDLFYFLRSLCVAAGEQDGRFGNFGAFEHYFLGESQLTALITTSIQRYVDEVKLDPALVKPLFYLCWVYWAIKQAAIVGPERRQTAFYWQSLQACITRPEAPTLAQIFSIDRANR